MRERGRNPVAAAGAGLLVVALGLLGPAPAEEILGARPAFTERELGITPPAQLPNARAIKRRIWSPGLDDGYVPQGLSLVGGALYLGTYRSTDVAIGRGPCRIFRIYPMTGVATAKLDLPPSCGHAGGLARGATPDRLWVVDTRAVFEVELTPGHAPDLGRVLREMRIEAPLRGSFAAADATSLWLGTYERGGRGRIDRIPFAALDGGAIGERHVTATVSIPPKAQGAAFDPAGRLWIAMSGASFGTLIRLNPTTGVIQRRYRLPAGLEDLSFDASGRLWTVSEAGSRRWNAWPTFFPLVFQLDPARLR